MRESRNYKSNILSDKVMKVMTKHNIIAKFIENRIILNEMLFRFVLGRGSTDVVFPVI